MNGIESEETLRLNQATFSGTVDPDAWVHEHWSDLWAFAYSLTGNADAANDLSQDTFTYAWSKLGQLRDTSRMKGWLCSIAKNRWLDQQKSAWRRRVTLMDEWQSQPSPTGDTETEVIQHILSDALWAAVLKLERADREVLILRAKEELDFREIAAIVGIREGSVRSRYRRALTRIRAILQDEGTIAP